MWVLELRRTCCDGVQHEEGCQKGEETDREEEGKIGQNGKNEAETYKVYLVMFEKSDVFHEVAVGSPLVFETS